MAKPTRQQVARWNAIRAKKKQAAASNDNQPVRSAYVDTKMTPGMLKACIEAAGLRAA